MKSVLISIQPKWCELIASGKKTIEVRKTAPKLQTPFKCYIYQTAQSRVCNNCNFCKSVLGITPFRVCKAKTPNIELDERQKICIHKDLTKGKVIGEFVCDRIDELYLDDFYSYLLIKETCISQDEIIKYTKARFDKQLYGWHISNLKIYDTPKELGEFFKTCPFNEDCDLICPYAEAEYHGDEFGGDMEFIGCGNRITRPPQSWFYVEGL